MRALLLVALACLLTLPVTASARPPPIDRLHFEHGNTCVDVYVDPFFPPKAGECCDDPSGIVIIIGSSVTDGGGTRPPCQGGTVIRIYVSRA